MVPSLTIRILETQRRLVLRLDLSTCSGFPACLNLLMLLGRGGTPLLLALLGFCGGRRDAGCCLGGLRSCHLRLLALVDVNFGFN